MQTLAYDALYYCVQAEVELSLQFAKSILLKENLQAARTPDIQIDHLVDMHI